MRAWLPRRKITASLWLVVGIVLCGAVGAVARVLALNDGGVFFPESHFEIIVDKEKTLSIGDVQKPEVASTFLPNHWIGWTSGAVWYRLTVNNPAPTPSELNLQIFHPWVTSVEFYAPNESGGFSTARAGNAIPHGEWAVDSPLPTFPFKAPAGGGATFYVRAMSEDLFQIPFVLLSKESFAKVNFYNRLFIAVFVGAALAMLFYNLLLYVSLRDKSYLWYVLYITCMTLLVLSLKGFAFQYLWPDWPDWSKRFNHLFGSLVQITGLMFARYFLSTKEQNPGLDKILKGYALIHAVYLPFVYPWPAAVFAPASAFTEASPLVFDILLFYAGFSALQKGQRAARYFVVSSLFTIFGMAIFILGVLGIFPYGFFADNSLESGFLLEIVLLSLALADRITLIQAERAEAQGLALENQRKLSGYLENAKAELEAQVEKRTGELRFAKEKAEQATKLKDKFMSLVSHDLKGPIGAMKGLMQVSMLPDTTPDEVTNCSRHCYESAVGLLEMIDKLLDISRLQTGAIRPDKTGVDFYSLSITTVAKVSQLAIDKGISLVNQTPSDMRLFADKTLVGEVLLNLLTNAIKFTPAGGTITVYSPGKAIFAVSDTGGGVPEKLLPDLFRHDVKTIGVGTSGEVGTGLGLPFCQDIMSAHGGKLRVENGQNGAVFFAEFPDEKPVVMLVDDQEVHRVLMREQIEKICPVDFVEASTGVEALAKLKNCNPVLIISDINMPDMNGFEFLKEVRKLHTQDELPVIISTAISGSSSPSAGTAIDNKSVAFELGANDFIMKPIIPVEFVPRVKRYL
ncbi:MAG: response regulator [Nitrospinae bacterium]|nr:response regulator [Nitrospinota bacterium]